MAAPPLCFDASYYRSTGAHGSTATHCLFSPKLARACPDTSPGGSLVAPVTPQVRVEQHAFGKYDERSYVKAHAAWQKDPKSGAEPQTADFITYEQVLPGHCPAD